MTKALSEKSGNSTVQRDPLESPFIATLLFGGVFLVATAYKFVKVAVPLFASSSNGVSYDGAETLRVALFFAGFAVGSGCTVAVVRRFLLAGRTGRARNFVTGGVVGGWYSLGCYYAFGRDMAVDLGLWVLHGAVLLGVWYAITSALNEVFRDSGGVGSR